MISFCEKLKYYQRYKDQLPVELKASFEHTFDVLYTHQSTALEGNTLSLLETKVVLEDLISIGGKKLREIYEIVNHQQAFNYVKTCCLKKYILNENIVKDIHALLMQQIINGGIYRNEQVYIAGASFVPPDPHQMYHQIKGFYLDLVEQSKTKDIIKLAAWTHAEFVRIHPFIDGNGRTARLLMNYQLLLHDYPTISVSPEDRLIYIEALDKYASEGDLSLFEDLVSKCVHERLDVYISLIKKTKK